MPVAIYTRVSTDNQVGGRFDSCESQAAICREHIEKHAGDGWYEVACYTDAAYSGGSMNRPGVQALKRQIESGGVKVVLIYKLERVMRSTDEWIPFRAFLKKHACRLESATEDLSESTPSGRLKNILMMGFSQYERENTAEKTLAKMQQQAKRGIWNGGMVPYGYDYDAKAQVLRPNATEAPVVRRVFELAAKLVTLTEIAHLLNAEGLRTKGREFRRRDGKIDQVGAQLFRSDGLRLLLRNPVYRGAIRFAGQEYAARHEPLVPSELWEKANAAVSTTLPRAGPRVSDRDMHAHLLKGLAHCGCCNRALVPTDSTKHAGAEKVYRYYACSTIMRQRESSPCPVGRVSADALERVVVIFLSEVSKHPAVAAAAIQHSETLKTKDRPILVAELSAIQKQLEIVGKKFKHCIQAVEAGGADVLGDSLRERATELRAEKDRLIVAREQKRQQVDACDATQLTEKRILGALERVAEILPKMDVSARREFIHLFVERVEVRKRSVRQRAGQPAEPARMMEVKVRLHVPRLVEAMDEKSFSETRLQRSAFTTRGLALESKVDFTRAHRGEVTITAPFTKVVPFGSVARPAPRPVPAPTEQQHAIHRAHKWQRMLKDKLVPHRFALAKQEQVTPGHVTRMLRLTELMPEIQDYLLKLRAVNPARHFPLREIGELAKLDPEAQKRAFARFQRQFSARIGMSQ
ncbi:MAG: recombinase family protein [Candidatus Didemnitutus sp.]|nr:recombinase family protein [Candidatus Didemnitutus sp.]